MSAGAALSSGAGYPAWAGIDPSTPAKSCAAAWLPRVGGDRPTGCSDYNGGGLVTPRGRG